MKSNVNQGCAAKTLHNTLSDCAYLFKNLRFLTVTVSEIVEQLKKYIQYTALHKLYDIYSEFTMNYYKPVSDSSRKLARI